MSSYFNASLIEPLWNLIVPGIILDKNWIDHQQSRSVRVATQLQHYWTNLEMIKCTSANSFSSKCKSALLVRDVIARNIVQTAFQTQVAVPASCVARTVNGRNIRSSTNLSVRKYSVSFLVLIWCASHEKPFALFLPHVALFFSQASLTLKSDVLKHMILILIYAHLK